MWPRVADCRKKCKKCKNSTAFIEKMVGKETKRKKKKEQKKAENDIVKRLAKSLNGLSYR